MKDYLSAETKETLNDLVRFLFQCNSEADNLVYNMQNLGLYQSASVFHENIAHIFPELSDMCTSEMDKLGCKGERRALNNNTEVYSEPIETYRAFSKLMEKARNKVLGTLEVLDYDMNNKEICLMLEDMSRKVLDLMYTVNKVLDMAEFYNSKEKMIQFDTKVDDYFEN